MNLYRRAVPGDDGIASGAVPVLFRVQKDSHMAKLPADLFPDICAVLPDACGKYQVIKAAKLRVVGTDIADDAVADSPYFLILVFHLLFQLNIF